MATQPPDFLGRDRELTVLEELADSDRPELFVLYGRRRVGKTELLQQLCRRRRAVYFLAAQVRDKDNLRAFRDALQEGIGDPSIGHVEFADWSAALGYAAERSSDERLIVVLDEFPYLCEANKGLPSLLQRFWDQKGKRSNLMLVLCGSQVSFMEREVLAERSPLFGRRTGQRRLEPLQPTEALAFFPRWSMRDRVLAYSILGGMPAYLRRFDDGRTLAENVSREMLRPEGYLFDEVQFLLKSELTSPHTYNSILAAVARGSEKVGDIALSVGVDSPTANKYLHVLRELYLVERNIPLTDPDPLRSRRGTYRVLDRFLAFHFRHLQPHLSLIEAGRGARVYEEFVEPDLPRLHDDAWTDFVLEDLARNAAELVGEEIVETGRWSGAPLAVSPSGAGPTGRTVARAIGRTVSGRGVLAALAEPDGSAPDGLAAEIERLSSAFDGLVTLLYAAGDDPEAPLTARRVSAQIR